MKEVIIGFSKPKKLSLYARAIMLVYGIPFDHVYIKLRSDTYQRDLIYQASKLMVNFMGYTVWDADNIVIKEFKFSIPDAQYVAMMQFCIDNAGKGYGIMEALGMGLVRILELIGVHIKNPWSDKKTFVCSELAAYIIDLYLSDNVPADPGNFNPLIVYNYLCQLESNLKVT